MVKRLKDTYFFEKRIVFIVDEFQAFSSNKVLSNNGFFRNLQSLVAGEMKLFVDYGVFSLVIYPGTNFSSKSLQSILSSACKNVDTQLYICGKGKKYQYLLWENDKIVSFMLKFEFLKYSKEINADASNNNKMLCEILFFLEGKPRLTCEVVNSLHFGKFTY